MLPAPRSRSPRLVALAVGALLLLAVGLWFGGHPSWLPSPLRSAFVSESATQKLENQVYGLLSKDYFRPVNRTALVNDGLAAAVESLDDPYSHYYDPANYHTFTDTETNPTDTGGIGVVVDGSTKTGLVIGEVYAKTPAAEAGVEAGDVITHADGHSFAGLKETQMTSYVRGQAGTFVTVTVQRQVRGKPAGTTTTKQFRIERKNISVPVTSSKLLNYHGTKVGYVDLTMFSEDAGDEVRAQVDKMRAAGAQALILDLRDNGGGLVDPGGQDGLDLHPQRHDRLDRGPRAAAPGLHGPRQRHPDHGPARRAGQPRHGVGRGDRYRRAQAARPGHRGRHAHLRQGCLPGDRPAAQRRRAGLHRRALLHARRREPRQRQGRRTRSRDQARRLRLHLAQGEGRHGAADGGEDRRVQAQVSPAARGRRGSGREAERGDGVPSRVGVLVRNGKFLTVEPFFGPGPRTVVSRDKRYEVGDLVLLGEPRGGGGQAHKGGSKRPAIRRRLGRPDVARDVIGALLLDRGADKDFDAAVQREARTAATQPLPEDLSRKDLRELPTFTIDPVTARDFDDAISAETLPGGGWRVWVHIADVAAYVTPRSLVDREGYRRATSVYVPGTVAPMLPGELSNGACSLVPGEDRPTVTVEMTIGEPAACGQRGDVRAR